LSDVIPPAEKAAAALAAHGFLAAPFTVPAWRAGEADARRVLAAPLFTPDWFTGDPKPRAAALVELDCAARDARDLARKLPEFDPDATRKIDEPERLAGLTPDRERLVNAQTVTARARVEILRRIEATLRSLARIATDLHATSRSVSGLLQVTRTPTADHLGTFAEVALQLIEGPPIPLEWWDAHRRTGVLDSFAQADQEERSLSAERAILAERFHPEAIDPEALMFVVEAARQSGSLWNRLWPSWWKTKKELHSWYRKGTPSFRSLRADILKLERFHRRGVAVRQVIAQHASDLLMGSEGRPDWAASAERVRAVEWLEHVGVQHTFKAAVGPRRTLNRTALGDAAAELARQSKELREIWTSLLTEFAVPDASVQLTRSAIDLATWFEEEAGEVRKEADALAVLVTGLSPEKDVLPGVYRERATALRDLVAALARIEKARTVLKDTRTAKELEAPDHSAEAARGRQLLELLDEFNQILAPPVVAAFTDPVVREKLGAALRQSESARRPFDKAWERVTADLFDPNTEVSTNLVLNKAPLAELKAWAAARASDGARLGEWARFTKLEQDAAAFGVGSVLDEVKAGDIPPAEAADAFRARFVRLWLDALHQQVPALGTFSADTHDRLITRFAETDRLLIRATPHRVRYRILSKETRPVSREGAPEGSELGILLREVNKKRRHMPLRDLFARIPTILQRLKPCLMTSPLAVSTYLDTPELMFDLVIFDEASQVRPHDAICAIYRGKQLVVGGDPRQLPPTDFFMRTGESVEEADLDDSGTMPFESLLDVCLALGLTRKPLQWHYRSRREALIAFSNRHFYDGRLVTFPSAAEGTGSAITFQKVADGRFKDGVNSVEARRVAELVIEHARHHPKRSLGVIAFSQRQQDRILDELEVLRRENPVIEVFFAEDRDDPFFVKNLENVQGDERDVIFLCVGYGPDETGKVPMRFGPLNRAGGERRLNVAITRARQSMSVISSMTAADIDLTRTGAEGAKLLKAFLDYAERGPESLPPLSAEVAAAADSPFEQAVADELVRRGLSVQRRVGFGGYTVDIAVLDPQRNGAYLLGVECDGASYRSAVTARDRDRLRRAVLEGLGWNLVRVWSTEWVRDRDKQVRRIFAALEAARNPQRKPPSVDVELEPMAPVRRKMSKAIEFDSIETVPEPALNEAIIVSLVELGSMPMDDLVAAVGKRLGFKRAGAKIRERVTGTVNGLVAAGQLAVGQADRVRLTEPPRP
jgi:very-short-patch-repair endonuclease